MNFIQKIIKKVNPNKKIEAETKLEDKRIGKHSYLGGYSYMVHPDSKIGKFCSIASFVVIGPGVHPKLFLSTHPFQYTNERKLTLDAKLEEFEIHRPVTIGNDVWIGLNTVIIDGVTIGDGAIIGANAVVTKNVEPYQIYVGAGGGG